MPGAVFNLSDFAATLEARGTSMPLCFARITDIHRGEVLVSSESLTGLFEQKIQQSKSSVEDVQVSVKDGLIHLKGKVHKGIGIPFEIEGPVTTNGTDLILNAKKIKAVGLPVKGLLGMLGTHLSSIINSESVNGVAVKDDALIFQQLKIAHVRGKIERVSLTPEGSLEILFGDKR
jgi:hypothetical protein